MFEVIIALVFDTTASNTGRQKGAATLIEKTFTRAILLLAFRHHIYKIFIKHVAKKVLGLRCGPSYQLFIRFQSEFGGLNQDTTDLVLLDWSTLSQDMEIQARKFLEWAEKCLNEKTFPRDDYHELVELTVVYLGRSVARGFKIRKPGAHHSARFLAYCIYIFKMEMMSDRFLLSQNERHQVHRLAVFIALIHSQAFLRSRIAIIAPALDTQYLFLLYQFKKEEKRVAEVAIHSFYNHLWYVTPELVSISFLVL